MGHTKLLCLHVGEYTALVDYSFSKNIQVNADPTIISKSENCLLGSSFWWYHLMGFLWLSVGVKIRSGPATEAGFKKENSEGQ